MTAIDETLTLTRTTVVPTIGKCSQGCDRHATVMVTLRRGGRSCTTFVCASDLARGESKVMRMMADES